MNFNIGFCKGMLVGPMESRRIDILTSVFVLKIAPLSKDWEKRQFVLPNNGIIYKANFSIYLFRRGSNLFLSKSTFLIELPSHICWKPTFIFLSDPLFAGRWS